MAEQAGLSMAALAVTWVLQNRNVSAAIVGASRPEQLVDNATAAGVTLDSELLARIDEVRRTYFMTRPPSTNRHDPVTKPDQLLA